MNSDPFTETGRGEDVSRVFRALADQRRRAVLQCLRRHGPLTLDELATGIAAVDRERPVDDIPAGELEDVRTSLYHCHLPPLEETGLVEYDRQADDVTMTDRGAHLERWLAELENREPGSSHSESVVRP